MVERQWIVDNYVINYEGIFSLRELYEKIDQFITDNNLTRKEIKNTEIVKKSGRNIEIIFEMWRSLSDYAKSVLRVKLSCEDVKDLFVEKGGIKHSMNNGKVRFNIYSFLETDFEHKWENTPGFFFVRVLFDKYIFKPFTTNYKAIVASDFNKFTNEMRAFLNLNKY
jgi:hypothetical protein